MRLTKILPKTDLQKVKDALESLGKDYRLITHSAELDSTGNFEWIDTTNKFLIAELKKLGYSQ